MRIRSILLSLVALGLSACDKTTESTAPAHEDAQKNEEVQEQVQVKPPPRPVDLVLDAQTDEVKARYQYRHPHQTLSFFGIEPGMTVVEALPGGGWYTKILLPLLGTEGNLVGADYALNMWPKFGFFNDEQLEAKKTWTMDWPNEVNAWGVNNSAKVNAFVFGSLPAEMEGSADAVLFVRAMHNLARFNVDGGYLDAAIADTYKVLKPGGIVGIVQHEARDDMPDEWAGGQNGYLKKSFIIEKMSAAGFKLAGQENFNENPLDKPSESDVVWRLLPGLYTSKENPELREELKKIGESNRMTLKFVKPE